MPEQAPDQMPFTVEYREGTREVVVWMTFGAGPKQTTRRRTFESLEALVIALTEHRHEAMLQNSLADTLADAAVTYFDADPDLLQAAVRALSDPTSTVPLGTLLYGVDQGPGRKPR
jgi:hypothetical protein